MHTNTQKATKFIGIWPFSAFKMRIISTLFTHYEFSVKTGNIDVVDNIISIQNYDR